MTKLASLNSNMLTVSGRRPLTKPMALAPDQEVRSPNAAKIAALVAEAREEIGYDRPNFIRVEHPDNMVPGTLMGRYRERVPKIERERD